MEEEGVKFVTNAHIGVTHVRPRHAPQDLTPWSWRTGATKPRDLPAPGRELKGIHFAMEFLTANTKSLLDSGHKDGKYISAKDKNVIVIGGGDTGNDCLGTSMRHGCRSLTNFELLPKPPDSRGQRQSLAAVAAHLRTDYGHEEATAPNSATIPATFQILTKEFLGRWKGQRAKPSRRSAWNGVNGGNGKFTMKEIAGTEQEWPADLVLLAMGFLGPEEAVAKQLGIQVDPRSNYKAEYGKYTTSD